MIHAVLYNGLEVPMLGIGTYSLGEEQIGNAIQCGYRLIDKQHNMKMKMLSVQQLEKVGFHVMIFAFQQSCGLMI